jgi:hypothetical protein
VLFIILFRKVKVTQSSWSVSLKIGRYCVAPRDDKITAPRAPSRTCYLTSYEIHTATSVTTFYKGKITTPRTPSCESLL